MLIATCNWTGWITLLATVVVAGATLCYAWLVWRQLRLSEPRVFPYIATRNGRPHVNVTNTGGATAYKVSVKIKWPEPPEQVKGPREPVEVESPEVGKLSPDETISFESPHEIVVREHFNGWPEYDVTVEVAYERGGKPFAPDETHLYFGKYMKKKHDSKMKAGPGSSHGVRL